MVNNGFSSFTAAVSSGAGDFSADASGEGTAWGNGLQKGVSGFSVTVFSSTGGVFSGDGVLVVAFAAVSVVESSAFFIRKRLFLIAERRDFYENKTNYA